MFKKWFSDGKNRQVEESVMKNQATLRLQTYIADGEEEEEFEDESINDSHLFKPKLINQKNEILTQSQKAVVEAEKHVNNRKSTIVEDSETLKVVSLVDNSEEWNEEQNPLVYTAATHQRVDGDEDIDFSNAEMSVLLKNIEDDPFADTEELLEERTGKKYVEVTVVYDKQNTIEPRTYTFETPSFTAFHEQWLEEIARTGTFVKQDVNGQLITINPTKCYTVEVKECK